MDCCKKGNVTEICLNKNVNYLSASNVKFAHLILNHEQSKVRKIF